MFSSSNFSEQSKPMCQHAKPCPSFGQGYPAQTPQAGSVAPTTYPSAGPAVQQPSMGVGPKIASLEDIRCASLGLPTDTKSTPAVEKNYSGYHQRSSAEPRVEPAVKNRPLGPVPKLGDHTGTRATSTLSTSPTGGSSSRAPGQQGLAPARVQPNSQIEASKRPTEGNTGSPGARSPQSCHPRASALARSLSQSDENSANPDPGCHVYAILGNVQLRVLNDLRLADKLLEDITKRLVREKKRAERKELRRRARKQVAGSWELNVRD